MSAFTSLIACSWSSVSWYGNELSNSHCHAVSPPNGARELTSRSAYSRSSSSANRSASSLTLRLVLAHSLPPSRVSDGLFPVPVYRATRSTWSVGTYSVSPPA